MTDALAAAEEKAREFLRSWARGMADQYRLRRQFERECYLARCGFPLASYAINRRSSL